MKKERKNLPLSILCLNTGQLDWLPSNPRTWTQTDIDRTAASIREDPDFLEDRPLLVVPNHKEGYFIVFAGNLRHEGAAKEKLREVPCVIYYPHTEEDFEAAGTLTLWQTNGATSRFLIGGYQHGTEVHPRILRSRLSQTVQRRIISTRIMRASASSVSEETSGS